MTQSAQILETPISGKYGRVFISNATGTTYAMQNFNWKFRFFKTDIPIDGFENFGFGDGLIGMIRADITLDCPVQVLRAGSGMGAGFTLFTGNNYLVYECYLIHPDNSSAFGILKRFTGVAQMVDYPIEHDVDGKPTAVIQLKSRGAIYLPEQSAPSPAAMLSLYSNTPT